MSDQQFNRPQLQKKLINKILQGTGHDYLYDNFTTTKQIFNWQIMKQTDQYQTGILWYL